MRMIEINRGVLVGGPFDGTTNSHLFYPEEYRDDLPPERTQVLKLFSKHFPEGAIYHWNDEKKEWHYVSPMEKPGEEGEHRGIFDAFGLKPTPPL